MNEKKFIWTNNNNSSNEQNVEQIKIFIIVPQFQISSNEHTLEQMNKKMFI